AAVPVLVSCVGQQAGTSPSPGTSGATGATGVGTRPKISGDLKILQWSHFVPDFDTYLDGWAKKWGDTNGVKVTIDRIPQADLAGPIGLRTEAQGRGESSWLRRLADLRLGTHVAIAHVVARRRRVQCRR